LTGEDSKASRILNSRILKVKISKIKVPSERLRHDIGNTDQLSMMIRMFGWVSPIVVTEDMRLVAGLRRLEALKKAGADLVEAQVIPGRLAWIIEGIENVERKQLNWLEEASYRAKLDEYMRRIAGENPEGGRPAKQRNEMKRNGEPFTNFSGPWSEAKTAELLGVSRTTITRDKELVDYARRYADVKNARNRKKSLQIVSQIKKKEEFRRAGLFPFVPKIRNIWTFQKESRLFGVEGYPAAIPGGIVLNVLHYYTKEGDLVVDPMAGGGATADACRYMKRRCLSYDIRPSRKFVKENDVREGFPEEAKGCDLIFLDPPYWKIKASSYKHDSRDVASLSLEDYLHFLKKLVQDCHETVKEGGHVAFLMQPYLPEPFEGDKIIDLSLIAHQYFLEASFKEKNRFSVPLAREDKHKGDFEKAERDGAFINLLRDLMIYVKD
jgi:DNA modification methylase